MERSSPIPRCGTKWSKPCETCPRRPAPCAPWRIISIVTPTLSSLAELVQEPNDATSTTLWHLALCAPLLSSVWWVQLGAATAADAVVCLDGSACHAPGVTGRHISQ